MQLKTCIAVLLSVTLLPTLHAQEKELLFSGKIIFEKKVQIVKAYEKYHHIRRGEKDTLPEFKYSYFDLYFDVAKTLYRPGEKVTNFNAWEFPAEDNIVFNDLTLATTVSSKRIEQNYFLFNEALRKLKWKMTEEVKNIAGFACKRANAALWDSVIVIAYYCPSIPVSGGPESFTGLPGMILGLEMPDEHTSIFATVVKKEADITSIKKPQRGEPVSYKELDKKLRPILATYGKDAEFYRKGMFL
ncbi:GLPGLI family protein [Terrimonas rubra]|uniref:GLPGLI family protein n=1 Tax=Terrimonas rubra TaxID=1035890 RepID=A0ABW6AB07_9BACT